MDDLKRYKGKKATRQRTQIVDHKPGMLNIFADINIISVLNKYTIVKETVRRELFSFLFYVDNLYTWREVFGDFKRWFPILVTNHNKV